MSATSPPRPSPEFNTNRGRTVGADSALAGGGKVLRDSVRIGVRPGLGPAHIDDVAEPIAAFRRAG